MAIAFNLPGIPSQIKGTPEEAGAMPDLSQAMMKGFTTALDTANKPRTMAQEYLGKQLENKIRGAQAEYAEPMAKTAYEKAVFDLAHAREMAPFEKKYKQALINKANRLAGGEAAPGHIPLTTASKTQTQQNTSYINETLHSLNELVNLPDKDIPWWSEKSSPVYHAAVQKARDQFAKAEKFPGVLPAFASAEDILKRSRFETPNEWRARVRSYINGLERSKATNLYNLQYGVPISGSYPNFNSSGTIDSNLSQSNDDEIKAHEEEMRKRGIKFGE